MKQCARCKQWKDESEFNWKNEARGKLQPMCRSCEVRYRHEWYIAHADQVKEKSKENKKKAVEAAERYVYEVLSNAVCADCKEYDFTVLTFDHIRGKKRMDISRMVTQGFPIETIKKEIALCEIVCASCHQRREFERRSGGRFRKYWPKWPWEK